METKQASKTKVKRDRKKQTFLVSHPTNRKLVISIIPTSEHMDPTFRHRRSTRTPHKHVKILPSTFTTTTLLLPHRRKNPRIVRCRVPSCTPINPHTTLLIKCHPPKTTLPRTHVPPIIHHRVEVRVVETGSSRSRIPRRLQRVNLCIGQIGRPRSQRNRIGTMRAPREDLRARTGRLSDSNMELAIVTNLRLSLKRFLPIQRYDIRVNLEGDNGPCRVGKLLHDEKLGTPILKQKQHQSVPDDALKHHYLHHEGPRRVPVHALEQWDPHDERVGERGEGEERDGPFQRAP